MWFTGDIGSAVATVQRESKILLVFGFGTDDLSKEVDALFQKSSQIGANQITFEKKFSKIFKKKISKIYNKKFQKFSTKKFSKKSFFFNFSHILSSASLRTYPMRLATNAFVYGSRTGRKGSNNFVHFGRF